MRFMISGKNINVTPALREKLLEKLNKLERFFRPDTEAQVTLSVEKLRQIIEVTIPYGGGIFRAEQSHEDMYTSIDDVVDVLEAQIRKFKGKIIDRNRDKTLFSSEFLAEDSTDDVADTPTIQIDKVKRFAIKPMDEEEAALEMELLRHNFFVFRNAETDEVNVVYKRKNGSYGLIEPEF